MTAPSTALVEDLPVEERLRAAAAVRSRFDRVLWQRLEVRDGELRAVVVGTRRRRPQQLHVGAAAALGLRDEGLPTIGEHVGSAS